MLLVAQQPSIITYSTENIDEEVCAKIEINAAKIFNDTAKSATTLDGVAVLLDEDEPVVDDGETDSGGGQTIEDVLFAPISVDVVRGVRIKVLKEGEDLDYSPDEAKAKPKISVFSNVDYLIGKLKESKEKEAEKKAAEEKAFEESAAEVSGLDDQEPVSIVWEVNGRTEPHRVWVFADGSYPEKGLCIKIDRFGAAKVLGSGEDDE